MAKILLVDDEPNMRLGLKDNLEFEGYEVDTANDGREGLAKLQQSHYSLVLLDVMMPHMNGLEVCKRARAEGINTPIIFLTAKGEEIDKVLGLELGADDYMTKPFSLRELLARVKAILRRIDDKPANNDDEPLQIGKLLVNFKKLSAYQNKKQIVMSHKEFEILEYLWQRKNSVVSRDDLLTNIWGYDENPTTRTVDNFIVKLRQKIEKDINHPQIIITVHGAGYKFLE
ncbi:MAG: response regulator transcription factor [Ignavibacteriales bacterium]|nr:response regulator transcription factor [Ignavibacteriales bacterium]